MTLTSPRVKTSKSKLYWLDVFVISIFTLLISALLVWAAIINGKDFFIGMGVLLGGLALLAGLLYLMERGSRLLK